MQQEERAAGAARFKELAEERYRLEERAEEQLAALLETLAELRDVDARQRRVAHHTVIPKTTLKTTLGSIVGGWLSARLGGDGGYVRGRVLVLPEFREKRLAELDGLAKKPERTKGAS